MVIWSNSYRNRLSFSNVSNRLLLTAAGVSLFAAAAVVNEVTVARYLSTNGTLVPSTIWAIRMLELLVALAGVGILGARSRLATMPTTKLMEGISVGVCALYIVLCARYALLNPWRNWDMLPYVASAMSYDDGNIERIHAATYQAAREAGAANLMAGSRYWEDMATNAEHFHQQLPFYQVKPMYVGLIYLGHKAGLSYVTASVVISVVSSVLMFCLIAMWLKKFTQGLLWGALTILSTWAIALTQTSRLSTPDTLSSFLILVSLYLLMETPSKVLGYCVLVLSLLARPDNILLAMVVIAYFNFAAPPCLAVTRRWQAVLLVAPLALSLVVRHVTGFYGWWTGFAHSFYGWMVAPAEFSEPFTIPAYMKVFIQVLGFNPVFERGVAFIGLFLIFTLVTARVRLRTGSVYSHAAIAFALAVVVRVIMFPEWEDRFYVAYYAMSVICFVAVWRTSRLSPTTESSSPAAVAVLGNALDRQITDIHVS